MKTEKSSLKSNNGSILTAVLKGAVVAIFVSLIGILIFALIIKFASLNSKVIKPVNQVIKIVSIFLGVFFTLRKCNNKGWLIGLLVGAVYSVLSFILFSILSGGFSFGLSILTDLLFLSIIGFICGIILINVSKKWKMLLTNLNLRAKMNSLIKKRAQMERKIAKQLKKYNENKLTDSIKSLKIRIAGIKKGK